MGTFDISPPSFSRTRQPGEGVRSAEHGTGVVQLRCVCLGSAPALEEKPGISDPFLQLLTKVAGFSRKAHHLQLFPSRRRQVMVAARCSRQRGAVQRGEADCRCTCALWLGAGSGSAWVFCAATATHSSLARETRHSHSLGAPPTQGTKRCILGKVSEIGPRQKKKRKRKKNGCANVEGKEKQVFLHFITCTWGHALGLCLKPRARPPPRKSCFKRKN